MNKSKRSRLKTEEVKETASQKPVQSEPAKSQTYINPEMIKRQAPRQDNRPPYDKNKNGAPIRNGLNQKPFAPNKGKAEVVAPAPNTNFKNNDLKRRKKLSRDLPKTITKRV